MCERNRQALRIQAATNEIRDERSRQIEKWGAQHHPDGTGDRFFAYFASEARRRCQHADRQGTVTWYHILAEEVYEAFAESDPDKLRTELIQVAAVAAAWVEDIDHRGESHEVPSSE